MTLSTALNAAVSGLRVTQGGINLVSQNVANAGSVGYTRRVTNPVQTLVGDRTAGVRAGAVERTLDLVAQRQLRLETAGAAYTSLNAAMLANLDRAFGTPGTGGSLDGALNTFTQSLQRLAGNPADFGARAQVLDGARTLAGRIASVANDVQGLRSEAEARLASGVSRSNDLLRSLAQLNLQIVSAPRVNGVVDAGLLDERDRLIDELSAFMDVQVQEGQGGMTRITTSAGLTLLDGQHATTLRFDSRGALGPTDLYVRPPGVSGVGTIVAVAADGTSQDVVAQGLIRSGEIGAALDLRDRSLVAAQRQLDELASALMSATTEARTESVAVAGGRQVEVPPGFAAGDVFTLSYLDGSGQRREATVLVRSGGLPNQPLRSPADPTRPVLAVEFGAPVNLATGAADLDAQLGASIAVTAAGTSLTVTASGAARIDGLAFSRVGTLATVAGGHPPLFVDAGSRDTAYGGANPAFQQTTGLAQRLTLNRNVAANGAELLGYGAMPGNGARPAALLRQLTESPQSFSAAAGIDGLAAPFTSPVADFARRVVEFQGGEAAAASRLDEGQQVALATVQGRYSEAAGVSIDQEMARLVQLQTAYGANARVMTAVRDLMDLLMRM